MLIKTFSKRLFVKFEIKIGAEIRTNTIKFEHKVEFEQCA